MNETTRTHTDTSVPVPAHHKAFGHLWTDPGLLEEAMTHKSYANEHLDLHLKDNERLEFLGDAVLETVVSHTLYQKYPLAHEGDLTKLRAQIVSKSTLAQCAEKLEIAKHLKVGKGLTRRQGKLSASARAVESLLGAVYLDSGIEAAVAFVQRVFRDALRSIEKGEGRQDFKSLLQEYALRRFKITPKYGVLSESGPQHRKRFIVSVSVGNRTYGKGSGLSKKAAEQSAAKKALKLLGVSVRGKILQPLIEERKKAAPAKQTEAASESSPLSEAPQIRE
ncbi:MAG: ribonuclease III [Candidatus Omnitrophica bacterium]|nr:ribonuclease III [Candidatus Omnitrophota bacterium]